MTNDFPSLYTGRLYLRQFNSSDLEHVLSGLSDPQVTKYYGVHFTKPVDAEKQLAWFSELEKNKTGIWWAICNADSFKFHGAAGIYFLNREHRKAEIGFWLLTEFWQMGIMSEALPPVVEYGFNSLGLHRIEGFVEPENLSSKRIMNKLKFNFEGTMQDCEIKNGRFISLDIYAGLK